MESIGSKQVEQLAQEKGISERAQTSIRKRVDHNVLILRP